VLVECCTCHACHYELGNEERQHGLRPNEEDLVQCISSAGLSSPSGPARSLMMAFEERRQHVVKNLGANRGIKHIEFLGSCLTHIREAILECLANGGDEIYEVIAELLLASSRDDFGQTNAHTKSVVSLTNPIRARAWG
jgi:hypothetical protein